MSYTSDTLVCSVEYLPATKSRGARWVVKWDGPCGAKCKKTCPIDHALGVGCRGVEHAALSATGWRTADRAVAVPWWCDTLHVVVVRWGVA